MHHPGSQTFMSDTLPGLCNCGFTSDTLGHRCQYARACIDFLKISIYGRVRPRHLPKVHALANGYRT